MNLHLISRDSIQIRFNTYFFLTVSFLKCICTCLKTLCLHAWILYYFSNSHFKWSFTSVVNTTLVIITRRERERVINYVRQKMKTLQRSQSNVLFWKCECFFVFCFVFWCVEKHILSSVLFYGIMDKKQSKISWSKIR